MNYRSMLPVLACAALVAGCKEAPVTTTPVVTAELEQPVSMWSEVAPHVYLRYQRIGHGDSTVVLLHPHTATLENWDEMLPYLASDKRTLVRVDTRGSGLSTKIRHAVTFAELTEDIRNLLDNLQITEPVVLVGDTVGAIIALQFAATYPDRAAGVVALGPTAYLEPQPERLAKFPDPLAPEALAAPVPPRPDAAAIAAAEKAREAQQEAVYPSVLRVDPERFARFQGIARAADPTSAALVMRANYSTGFAEVFSRINVPVLMTAGTLSPRSLESFRELAAGIPGVRFVELETGHYASAQSPELAGPLVQEFLAELNR